MGGPVVLIGMMGSGKSSVGRELARLLGREWKDLDDELERRFKLSVARQFEAVGEAGFRRREHEMFRRLAGDRDLVLSAGGGLVLLPENRALLKRATAVYLQASPQRLLARLSAAQAARRPLLKGPHPGAVLRRLARLRSPLYRSCAAVTVRAAAGGPAEVAQRVAKRLERLEARGGRSR